MNHRSFLVLASIWLIMFWCNCLDPMVGDDYLYSYIIGDNTIFYRFDPAAAVPISSLSDIIVSQWNHYMLWGGRTVAHCLVQFFVWQGEILFDIANAAVFVVLVMEIHWIIDRGRVSLDFIPSRLVWIFFAIWIFSVDFSPTLLWTTGACNYLWTDAIVLTFLLPYVRQWFSDQPLNINPTVMFVAGTVAGWTNENNVCWFIIVGAILCRQLRADGRLKAWAIAGLIGMSIGYALLILAPGNFNRAILNTANAQPLILEDAIKAGLSLGTGLISEILMWYFFIRTLMNQKEFGDSIEVRRSLIAAKTFAIVSALSSVILLLSPEFAFRSLFPGLIYLIIAVTIVVRLQHETQRNTIDRSLKIFFRVFGGALFIINLCSTIMILSIEHSYYDQIRRLAQHEHDIGSQAVLEVPDMYVPEWLSSAALHHSAKSVFECEGAEVKWFNRIYAHYYGIAGIVRVPDKGGD